MQTTALSPWALKLFRKSLIADIILVAIAAGPLAAPFLAASGWPVLTLIADIIHGMGRQVCPQPEMGLMILPAQAMSVCMRCYGTVMGLVAMRGWYHRDLGKAPYWLHQYGIPGLVLTILLCLVYPAELYAQSWGWWGYHNWVVFPFGLVSGLGLGAYLMPILHSPTIETHKGIGRKSRDFPA